MVCHGYQAGGRQPYGNGGNERDARPLALMPVSVRMHTVPNIYLGAKKSNHNIVIDP